MPNFVGTTQDQILPANTAVRLTFSEANSWNYLAIMGGEFAHNMSGVLTKLSPLARVIPYAGTNGIAAGDTVAVVDAMSKIERTGAQLANTISGMLPAGIELTTVQVLSKTEQQTATSTQGATDRASARVAGEAAQTAASWATSLKDGLGAGLDTLKLLGVVALIVLILIKTD